MQKKYHLNYHFVPPKDLGDVKLVQIGRLYCTENMVIDRHVHLDWFEITIVTAGEGTLLARDCKIPVKSGDVFLSLPAETHAIYSSGHDPLKYDFFSFSCDNPDYQMHLEMIMQTFCDPASRLFTDARIPNLVQNAIAEFRKDGNFLSEDCIKHLLHLIVIHLLRIFPKSDTSFGLTDIKQADELCYQLMNYIDTHIFNLKNLTELTAVTSYNYSYLSTLFRKTTGQTLQDYYSAGRLRTAKSLVKEGNLKMTEISELLHYSSVYAFSKAYKRKYGISPSLARKLRQERAATSK